MKTTFDLSKAFVWVWLPNATIPIVAGKLEVNDGIHYDFFYGKSYLKHPTAMSLSPTEMPLQEDIRFSSSQGMHLVFRDSLPDAWGQRILFYKYPAIALTPLNILLLSSSDRIGAFHFQETATTYQPQYENSATLEELMESASYIEQNKLVPENLAIALFHGTSVGGARPKALIDEHQKKYIAKFSSTTDIFPIVQAEFAAMWLAKKVGITASPVKLVRVAGKYILLVERFDRIYLSSGWSRKLMISALTLLGLSENEGRYASYLDLSDQIRKYSKHPLIDLHELFRRIVFNILIGNTDDHAKNHAFFWDGQYYAITPAYDICPYLRFGQQATQAMIVGSMGSFSLLTNALSSASYFQLSPEQAKKIIEEMVDNIKKYWPEACDRAELTEQQKNLLMGTAVLNPYCFYDTP